MKRKIIFITLTALFALAALPATALAYDYGGLTYNDNDFNKLQAFLETEYSGLKNGLRLSPTYNKDDPATWAGVTWNSDAEKRITGIVWHVMPVGGPLDISGCTALASVDCSNNKITSVNASGCTSLSSLRCNGNDITLINLTGCSALTQLTCSDNNLSSLDFGDTPLLRFLYCNVNANITALNISGLTHLEEVDCAECAIATLNATGSSVSILDCGNNPLTTLTLAGCTGLDELTCKATRLTSLNLSGFSTLTDLDCGDSTIGTLTLTGCSALTTLQCPFNRLSALDVSGCSNLGTLDCRSNALTALDLSGNAALTGVMCNENAITSLKLNANIQGLYCGDNALETLDVSSCTKLVILDCTGNPLQSVDAVYGGASVHLAANGSGYAALYFDGTDYYAVAAPTAGAAFVNWTRTADNTAASASAQYGLTGGTAYSLNANFLSLSPSVSSGNIYTGGRITLTPSIPGGTWSFNSAFLSRSGNEFTGLKAGTAHVTYTVGAASVFVDVTILQSGLPNTGQDFSLALGLLAFAALAGAVCFLLFVKRSEKRT